MTSQIEILNALIYDYIMKRNKALAQAFRKFYKAVSTV